MRVHTRRFALAAVAALSLAAGAAGAASQPFRVTSTLDGKTVLPHRIHWLAFPKVPSTTKVKVEFLIDGIVRWHERDIPYTYSDDGGYLVTSWLRPGMHRFTVRATIVRVGSTPVTNGQVAEDTVVARVLPAAEPPAALAGTWQRTPDVHGHPTFPAGHTSSSSNAAGSRSGSRGSSTPRPPTPTAQEPVRGSSRTTIGTRVPLRSTSRCGPVEAVQPKRSGRWILLRLRRAGYRLQLVGRGNTLPAPAHGKDPCAPRGFLWTGQWTRVR